ncbi:MAG: hypothetical protein IT385_23780 [Deltaproteobacteria bacterium]|nr:hypothetical protein [Deltaproteobacteria bacterium]
MPRLGSGLVVGLLALAIALGACGDRATTGAGRGPIPLGALRAELAATVCRVYATCPSLTGNDNSRLRWIASDLEACIAYWTPERSERDLLSEPIAAAEAGLVRYDGALMRRCLDQVEATCRLGFFKACEDLAFDGLVPLGGACDGDNQCAGDAFCELGDTCGVCVASLPLGATCDYKGCSQLDGPAECVEHVCVAHTTREVALGAPCDWYEPPKGDPEPVCPAGSACIDGDPDLGTPSACRPHVPVGQPCGPDDVCADLAFCLGDRDPETGEVAGTCTTVALQDQVGAPCDETHACSVFARLTCVDGRCASVGTGGAGTRCSVSDFHMWPSACLVGFACDPETRTCVRAEPACDGDDDCLAGERCLAGECSYLGGGPCPTF